MSEEEIRDWLLDRLPESWKTLAPQINADDDEILVVIPLADTEPDARHARARSFREETRDQRMHIAQEAERRFGRRLAWGVAIGEDSVLFTSLSIPVMTRLRLPERQVLDTLVQAGVARSRSEALAWCVRLVGRHEADWMRELRGALVKVGELRRRGPK